MPRKVSELEKAKLYSVLEQQAWAHSVDRQMTKNRPLSSLYAYGVVHDEAMIIDALREMSEQQLQPEE